MTPLHTAAMASLRWFFSVGGKFFRSVPGYTLTVVFATLVSQLTLIVAFFLPLKVIILLGSSSVPRYFPQAWQALAPDHLILALSLTAVCFYLLHLLAEQLTAFGADRGARRLLEKSNKITLFANQDEVANRAYQRYARSLAGVAFIILAACALAILYPALGLLFIGYWLTVFLLLSLRYKFSENFRARLDDSLGKTPNTLAAIGFLLIFALIVADFLLGSAPSVLIAIVTLILSRQVMQRVAGAWGDIAALRAQQLQINALFFHRHVFLAEKNITDHTYWPLLEEPRRSHWIAAVLSEVVGAKIVGIRSVWQQTGVSDVFAFEVTLGEEGRQEEQRYLVKLFNTSRRALALQEATLFAECQALALPAPEFLGASLVDKLHCHVFRWQGEQKLPPRQVKTKALDVAARLLAIEPPAALVARYGRSRPYLWQRLDKVSLEHLRLAARDAAALEQIDCFAQVFERIQSALQALPLQLINPDVNADSLHCVADGNLLVSHWGRWSLDPLGAGWPINEHDFKLLAPLLEQAQLIRSKLAPVAGSQVALSALMFAFERMLQRQQLLAAIDLLPAILNQVALGDANPPIP